MKKQKSEHHSLLTSNTNSICLGRNAFQNLLPPSTLHWEITGGHMPAKQGRKTEMKKDREHRKHWFPGQKKCGQTKS